MPRPIIFTEEMKEKARDEFSAMLDSMRLTNGKLKYSTSFLYKSIKAIVWLSPEAYKKSISLVLNFSDEVGWHGTASRIADNEYLIEDIYVYPQEVTGCTVVTDQVEYTKWLYAFDDETFNKIRMQSHSHANMGVSPSSDDEKHREQILAQLEGDMFYIFMIWNKSLKIHTLVYDMKSNILYEDADVDVALVNSEDMDAFHKDARKKVKKQGNRNKQSTDDEQLEIDAAYDRRVRREEYSLHELRG